MTKQLPRSLDLFSDLKKSYHTKINRCLVVWSQKVKNLQMKKMISFGILFLSVIMIEKTIGGQIEKVAMMSLLSMKKMMIKLRFILCQIICGLKNTDQRRLKIVSYLKT